jgi:hypothetical protein
MKYFVTFFTAIIAINTLIAQERTQILSNGNFKIKCSCELKINTLFIQMAKERGSNNIIAAYVCAENEDAPETAVINNINIYDESASYKNISLSYYNYFDKRSLEVYVKNLKNAGIEYNYVTYKGVAAVEYSFEQQGLPTKAIFFLKNKKSYLIQAGTRANLNSKFYQLKYSFDLL